MIVSLNSLIPLLTRLADRNAVRTEADIQADVRQLFLTAPLQLEESDVLEVLLESPVGDRRRIDVEVGSTVVEVKRDLRRGRIRTDALDQLAGYVQAKTEQTGRRYVGVLTDGCEWICYNLANNQLQQVSALVVSDGKLDIDRLIFWLEGVLATARGIKPTADEIAKRLGASSSAYALDRASLAALFKQNKNLPTIQMKRTLWSRLLTSALGTQFQDSDELFIEHTLLVNSAEIIAHAVLGLPVEGINPASLLLGTKFDESGIYGVVEADFFDWVIEVPGGEEFIRTLARRLARFDWSTVEQDVLKVLYQSVIGAETRKRLGEYYTPDWLAEAIVEEVISHPLASRVLDTACGSGTFLFHAIRKYIAAAEACSIPMPAILEGVTSHILGMDLHPVAVTLARVTYLLAIGRDRLIDPSRGTIQVPVYLGDSIQWQEQKLDLWSAGNLVIHADDKRELFAAELRFPDFLLENAALFDELVNDLAAKATTKRPSAPAPSLSSVYKRLAIPEEARATIDATFKTMCRLHDEGRDHIWGYYVRNLARPMWLSRDKNRVDVLIGNPPWLAYRHMTPDMQKAFRRMSEARGLWAGAEVATHQDLSALFITRSAELYLKKGGRVGMVMPNAAVDREHYEGFRSGSYVSKKGEVFLHLSFSDSWDLRRIRPHFFPRASCVIFAERTNDAHAMPEKAEVWRGRLPASDVPWSTAELSLERAPGSVRRLDRSKQSPYEKAFLQGATLTPRLAFVVEPQSSSPLGLPAGKIAIISSRSVNEKKPWKDLPSIDGVVESEFVRPTLSGENLLPFRITSPFLAVLPCTSKSVLKESSEIELYPGLASWWEKATEIWKKNRSSENMSLAERLNYQSTFLKQLPIPELRIVYNRAGMHLCASKLKERRAIIANGLYWATTSTEAEIDYLCAIMNAPITTELLRPLMSYGKDERDIHKHVWQLPIAQYDPNNLIHVRLAELAQKAEILVGNFSVNQEMHFAATRRHIREMIEKTEIGVEMNDIVYELLS